MKLKLLSAFIVGFIVSASAAYLLIHQPSALPSFFVSCVALIFAYLAYYHTLEKFRLELFTKRWEIYENLLSFCSDVAQLGPKALDPQKLDTEVEIQRFQKTMQAAYSSFRGKGWHQSQCLFGKDIIEVLEKVNSAWAHLTTYTEDILRDYEKEERINMRKENLRQRREITNLLGELPDKLKAYMDFSHYKLMD